MTEYQSNPWKTLRSTVPFENPWMRIVKNDVINPSGGEGEYTVVHFKNRAVAVVPVDDEGFTWLVGQYRYATRRFEWEIPEGGAPEGESTLECAKRELAEEVGLSAASWQMFSADLQLSNSLTDELGYSYLARQLMPAAANPDDTEKLYTKRVPLADAIEMASTGDIRDAFSIVTLLRLNALILRGEISI